MGNIKTAFNMSGEVWFAGGDAGLYRSSIKETFTQIKGIKAYKIAFEEEEGRTNPTVCMGKP